MGDLAWLKMGVGCWRLHCGGNKTYYSVTPFKGNYRLAYRSTLLGTYATIKEAQETAEQAYRDFIDQDGD